MLGFVKLSKTSFWDFEVRGLNCVDTSLGGVNADDVGKVSPKHDFHRASEVQSGCCIRTGACGAAVTSSLWSPHGFRRTLHVSAGRGSPVAFQQPLPATVATEPDSTGPLETKYAQVRPRKPLVANNWQTKGQGFKSPWLHREKSLPPQVGGIFFCQCDEL